MDRARQRLLTTADPVEEVARGLGFGNLSHFRRVFAAHVGVAPATHRRLAS
jgi:transcriptional regulator GlxA family with amidase domain